MNHIEVMKQARDWIAERPEDRPISAGKMVSILDKAIAEQGRDWSLLEATQDSLREHMAEIKRLKALLEQPALMQEPVCQICGGMGEMDSGGTQPWGEAINIPCECTAPPAAQPEPWKDNEY
jgi:hypothetical protein